MSNGSGSRPFDKGRFTGGVFLFVLMSVFLVLGPVMMIDLHDQYEKALISFDPVIIQEIGSAIFYTGWWFLLGVLMLSGHMVISSFGMGGVKTQAFFRFLTGWLLIGIFLVLLGYYYGNKYWAEAFMQGQYYQCSGSFSMTGKWQVRVWVDNPNLCRDPEVRARIRSYKFSLEEVNHYIREQRQL